MDGQALAGEHIGATANMEAIARYHLGEDVRICWQPSQHWLGLARRTAGGPEILLNPGAAAADLGFILHHEIGHHACGHVWVIDARPAADLVDDDTPARLARLTPTEAAVWTGVIDEKETEANDWARDALAAFEGRFGPFLGAIGGDSGDE